MPGDDLIIRPSSLVDYADCSRRWAARHMRDQLAAAGYQLRHAPPAGAGALVGSGVHAGAGYTLEQMRETGAPGQDADAIEAAVVGFRERAQIEGADWDDTTDSPNTAEKQIARMVRVYRWQVAPQVQPVLIEERAEAEFAPGIILSGQLDTLAAGRDAAADGSTIRDLKTGTRRRMNAPQYGAYSMIFQAHGYQPNRIVEDYIRRVPLRQEQPDAEQHLLDMQQARQDAWGLLRAITRDVTDFQARAANPRGEFPPGAFLPNPASALCSPRWCPAWGTDFCKSHKT